MTDDQEHEGIAADDARFWIAIESWDWNLSVALSSPLNPVEQRFQGGLDYARSFELWGRVLGPTPHRGKTIRIRISPFGTDLKFGQDELDEVGRLYFDPPLSSHTDLSSTLLLPESSSGPLAICLDTVSRYLFVTIFDPAADQASIDRYAFSSTLPEGVTPLPSP